MKIFLTTGLLSVCLYLSSIFILPIRHLEESSISLRFKWFRYHVSKMVMHQGGNTIEQFNPHPKSRRDISIIGIDTNTLDKLKGEWPISWNYYGNIMNAFQNTRHTTVFDIFFIFPRSGIDHLTKSLSKNPNVIVAYPIENTFSAKGIIPDMDQRLANLHRFKLTNILGQENFIDSYSILPIPPLPEIGKKVAGMGFANLYPNENEVFRKMPLITRFENDFYPSLDLITVCQHLGIDVVKDTEIVIGNYIFLKNIPSKDSNEDNTQVNAYRKKEEIRIPIDTSGSMEINFFCSRYCFKDEEFYEVATEWDGTGLDEMQKTIFLISSYYQTGMNVMRDISESPFGTMAGAEFHAHTLNTILNQEFITHSGDTWNLFILLFLGFIFGLTTIYLSSLKRIFSYYAFGILFNIIAILLFVNFSILIPMVSTNLLMLFLIQILPFLPDKTTK